MVQIFRLFFALLRAGLFGKPADCRLFLHLEKREWEEVYRLSVEQAVTGVVWDGLLTLPKEQQPHKSLWYKWLGRVLRIEKENEQLNEMLPVVLKLLSGIGLPLGEREVPVALLKGQGTAALYRNPLRRIPGDIDVYAGDCYGTLEQFLQRDESPFERVGCSTKHTTYLYAGVSVENHRYVALFFCPWLTWRLRRLVREWFPKELKVREIAVPGIGKSEVWVAPAWFEALFAVIHFRAHLHLEGVGWRQLCDWWLIRCQLSLEGEASEQRFRYERGLRLLGLVRMEEVMEEVFEKLLLRNERPESLSPWARKVCKEMAEGGNFGHHAADAHDHSHAWQKGFWRTLWNLWLHDVSRSVRFFYLFPGEAVFSPFFRIGGYIRRRGR